MDCLTGSEDSPGVCNLALGQVVPHLCCATESHVCLAKVVGCEKDRFSDLGTGLDTLRCVSHLVCLVLVCLILGSCPAVPV